MKKFIFFILNFISNMFHKEFTWEDIKFPIVYPSVLPVKVYSGFKQIRRVRRTTKEQLKKLNIKMYFGPEGEKIAFKEWLQLNPNTEIKSIEEYRKASRIEKKKYMYWVYATRPTHTKIFPVGYSVYYANTDENQKFAVVNSKKISNDLRSSYISSLYKEYGDKNVNEWGKEYYNNIGKKWGDHVSSTSRTFDENK